MKLATFTLMALAEAKIKMKGLEMPDKGFFFMEKSDEKHMGLPDNNKAYKHYIEPTQRERDYHGGCFHGSPHDLGVKDGQHSDNSMWRCALVNKKRANADRPRDFVCFPQCTNWTKKKQDSNPDSFVGCRLHAPITNPINGWATCQKGKWVVEKPLKKCFCDLCDPRDAQKQLRKKQRQGRHEDYGADFSNPHTAWDNMNDNRDFASHSHQQIIVGQCGPTCVYQPVGYQQGKDKAPIAASKDPPTAVCDRKKREWNFKDKCNCIDLCNHNSPGLPDLGEVTKNSDPLLPARHWNFKTEIGNAGENLQYNYKEMYNFAELNCGTELEIKKVCGDKGLKKREKRHYFCANGEWISGADNDAICNCEKNKKKKHQGTKSKDKHNKDKPKKNKQRPNVNDSDERPNKPAKKEQSKHKKNKH